MNTSVQTAGLSRFKVTLAMVLCGFAAAGAANAASLAEGDVPSIAVKYDAASLGNDAAVRALYARIVVASRDVCPDMSVGRWEGAAAAECRKQAIARAVKRVNNPRLAALYVTTSKSG